MAESNNAGTSQMLVVKPLRQDLFKKPLSSAKDQHLRMDSIWDIIITRFNIIYCLEDYM